LKLFEDMEATVVGVEEMQHNGNDAFTNELGRTARSSCKGGKVGLGVLGKLNLVGMTGPFKDVAFDCGTGFDAKQREDYWDVDVTGMVAKIKYFPVGSKDKPRHPVFLGWRDKRDL
jgi:DNA ligase-1